MRSSSPEANTCQQKICYFIDILMHPPEKLAKKRLLAAVALVSLKKRKKKSGLGGATFQVVVACVKLQITDFYHTKLSN